MNFSGSVAFSMVKIKKPDIKTGDISCNKEFNIADDSSDGIMLRICLKNHECAIIELKNEEA